MLTSRTSGNIKLPKQGLYKDSIRIPIFTVRSGVGDSITTLLPTVVGIIKPSATVIQPLRALDSTTLTATADKATEKSAQSTDENAENVTFEDVNGNSTIGKNAFTLSPNPSRNETSLTYQFSKATDVIVEVKTTSGQVVLSKILRGGTMGTLEIQTTNWANGTYFLALQYDKVVKTKKFVVQH